MTANNNDYDRRKDLQDFEDTKLGVKGLVDSGITHVPRIFHHPPETLFDNEQPQTNPDGEQIIPVIDLSGKHEEVVKQLRDASAKFGFFQVINHGISVSLLDRLLDAIKAFHELQPEEKMQVYHRETVTAGSGVGFYSNYDLFQSKAASWRDTLAIRLAPIPVDPSKIHDIISNDEYKSGEHRVYANPFLKPRVSIAYFLSPGIYENLYGPLPELVSPERPALYQQHTFSDLVKNFFSKELEGKSMTSYFRL